MMDVGYLRTIHRSIGANNRNDLTIKETQSRLDTELRGSINYKATAKRNGVVQPMCLVPTDVRYKCEFICLPSDDIFPGDIIDVEGQTWIVIESNNTNPLQKIGMAWLCNHQFSFQNWDSRIIQRWGVLDSGVYSTTLTGNSQVQEPDKQFKIYLPYDEDTKKIYIDKRFAVDTRFDSTGQEILECYRVTGLNHVARSYGQGAHLLILEIRSDQYSETRDNKELLICDYITNSEQSSPYNQEEIYSIIGKGVIPIGMSRKYTIQNSNKDSYPLFTWSVDASIAGVRIEHSDTEAIIHIEDNTKLIGEVITLVAENENEGIVLKKEVEVTA